MFEKILHANDGSKSAFHALSLAVAIAKQNQSELHTVCVEKSPICRNSSKKFASNGNDRAPFPRRSPARACHGRRTARKTATHIVQGHPVRDVVKLAADLDADLLVIGAIGHSAL